MLAAAPPPLSAGGGGWVGSSQAPRKGGAVSRAEILGKEGSLERAGHRAHWGLVARTMPGTTGV